MGFSASKLICWGKGEDISKTLVFEENENREKGIDTISFEFFDNEIPPKIFKKLENDNKIKEIKNEGKLRTKNMDNILFDNEKDNESIKNVYYKGEINDKGEKDGFGEMLIINKNDEKWVFYGKWEHDEIKEGKIYFSNGDEYIGQIKNYLRDGKGIFKSDFETYDGEWKNDQIDGEGSLINKNNIKYEGHFTNNKYYGKGKLTYPDGTHYSGEFVNNLFDGQGFLEGSNKHIYNGGFQRGKFHGYGEFKWIEEGFIKETYSGNYSNGKKNGKGKLVFKNGNIYEGNWVSGEPHGVGIYETPNRKYQGNWRNGLFMQLIDVEEKEDFEEEGVDINFKAPIEDINIPDQIESSLRNNFSYRSILIKSSEVLL